jgi:ABC-type transporter Mla subunit MlaD
MSDQARYFRVGAFVLGGIALAVLFVLILGGGSLLRRPLVAETVFAESVQGLEVGSPVKLRGVKIGAVSEIGFVGNAYDLAGEVDPALSNNLVLVRMELTIEREVDAENQKAQIASLVEKGLRLRLQPLGITGTSFIQADYLEADRYPPMQITWQPENLYVPSAPSTIAQLSTGAERLITRIGRLDVEGLLTNLDTLLVQLSGVVGKADIDGVQRSLAALLDDARRTSTELRGAVGPDGLRAVNADARKALGQLTATLAGFSQVLDASSEDFATALANLRVASENLRDASETARSYPSLLIFGEPPKKAPGAK